MTDKAVNERQKQVQNLKARLEKTMKVREFLTSEREIVMGLLEKSLGGQDLERVSILRNRIQEKERQLYLVEEELREILAQLAEKERRLRESQKGGPKGSQ